MAKITPSTLTPLDLSKRAQAAITPERYGIIGAGDDSAALNAAFAAAATLNLPVVLNAPLYTVLSELVVSSGITIRGVTSGYQGKTIIQAGTAMRSVAAFSGEFGDWEGVQFDAARLATYAIAIVGAGNSKFSKISVKNALRDGVRMVATGINDGLSWYDCTFIGNGTLYGSSAMLSDYVKTGASQKVTAAGTVSITSGSQTLTGSGTSFTTLGLRVGDMIRIGGANPAAGTYAEITSVDSDTQITLSVRRVPPVTLSAQNWVIGCGDAYHEERYGDNNIGKFINPLFRGSAGSGVQSLGLYGSTFIQAQSDSNAFYGFRLGLYDNNSPVYRSSYLNPYCEDNFAAAFSFAFGAGFTVTSPMFGTNTPYHLGLAVQNSGVIIGHDLVLETVGSVQPTFPAATASTNLVNTGTYTSTFGNQQVLTASSAVTITTENLRLISSADVTLTATPSIVAGADGQRIVLQNFGSFNIILQDYRTLASSGVQLKAAGTLTLPPGSTAQFIWNPTYNRWFYLAPLAGTTVQSGVQLTIGGGGIGAGGVVRGTVTFPVAYPSGIIPSVRITPLGNRENSTTGECIAFLASLTPGTNPVTNTGFEFYVKNSSAAAQTISAHWSADG